MTHLSIRAAALAAATCLALACCSAADVHAQCATCATPTVAYAPVIAVAPAHRRRRAAAGIVRSLAACGAGASRCRVVAAPAYTAAYAPAYTAALCTGVHGGVRADATPQLHAVCDGVTRRCSAGGADFVHARVGRATCQLCITPRAPVARRSRLHDLCAPAVSRPSCRRRRARRAPAGARAACSTCSAPCVGRARPRRPCSSCSTCDGAGGRRSGGLCRGAAAIAPLRSPRTASRTTARRRRLHGRAVRRQRSDDADAVDRAGRSRAEHRAADPGAGREPTPDGVVRRPAADGSAVQRPHGEPADGRRVTRPCIASRRPRRRVSTTTHGPRRRRAVASRGRRAVGRRCRRLSKRSLASNNLSQTQTPWRPRAARAFFLRSRCGQLRPLVGPSRRA